MKVSATVFAAQSGSPHVALAELCPGSLKIALHDGTRFELLLADLEPSTGGASGRMLFLRSRTHGTTVAIEAAGFPEALRAAAGGALDAPLDAIARSHRGARHWDRIVLGVLLGLGLLFGVVVLSLPRLVRRAMASVPTSVDRSIGDTMIDVVAPPTELVHDPVLTDAVARIVARLEPVVPHEGFAYRFRVLRSEEVNAFALPGGQIVVCAGLLARAERPEAVAGVLAHEIAHVTERHALESMASNLGISMGLRVLFGQIDFLPGYAQDGALLAAMRGFSQAEELEADTVGVRTLVAADVDPAGLSDVFRTLAATPGTEMPGMLTWMSTHPRHDERIANIERLRVQAGARSYRGFDGLDWPAVRAAAERAMRAPPLIPSPLP